MAIAYGKDLARFDDVASVEEAETLLQWVQDCPSGQVDFTTCRHLHAANLQVLMAARVAVAAWPQDEELALWLQAALTSRQE
ncbi:MAG: hypothetical protein V4724_15715 [Pseudomonadota bacterium]